jgi:hypothetical protein
MSFKSKYSGRDIEETIEKVLDLPNDLKSIIDSLCTHEMSDDFNNDFAI